MILKTGDVVLTRSNKFMSKAIRFFTKTNFSHAGVIVMNWDTPFINEALGKGLTASPFLDAYKGHYIRISRPDYKFIEKDFATKANSKIGITGYDFSSLLWYQAVFQITGHWYGHSENFSTDKFYCTEYVGWMHEPIFSQWWTTSPKEIEENKHLTTIFEGIL